MTLGYKAIKVKLNGIVQGVGMRPHVYRLALEQALCGWVLNSAAGVEIHAEGPQDSVDAFAARLLTEAPPLALITEYHQEEVPFEGFGAFEIRKSVGEDAITVMVSPDIATCKDCRREIADPGDRRYRYPFTNCTNCGPRFTIIRDLPYDRARTSMADFPMCPECYEEYENPLHRRFHAQPNACPVCGPRLKLVDSWGEAIGGSPVDLLKAGKILGVKGLGGFHLAVNAGDASAVRRLRTRKRRDAKPFALMARDLDTVRKHALVSELEAAWLQSARAPIVILDCPDSPSESLAAEEIHPGLPTVGFMLPYTPLHLLLFDEELEVLVMTSANISDEPLIIGNDEALEKLGEIADAFWIHDRKIENPCDDSVVMQTNLGHLQFFRRARGFVPQGQGLPFASKPVLAAGPEMKNTFCVVRQDQAFVSQHWGDLNHYLNYLRYTEGIDKFTRMLDVVPERLVCDLHPEYQATRWAREQTGIKLTAAQHHWAHLCSVMAEHALTGPVLGLICDGTGMGEDGQIWGGELLAGDYQSYKRIGHLEYVPYPGGDLNARRPYRMAAIYLQSAMDEESVKRLMPLLPDLTDEERSLLSRQLDISRGGLLTSSCGRLFDAVSAVAGICPVSQYDGQAAVLLEAYASSTETGAYPYCIDNSGLETIMSVRPMWEPLIHDIQDHGSALVSARFHNTLVNMFMDALMSARDYSGINRAVLSGGVFHNQRLLVSLKESLAKAGFETYVNQAVPPGDGGISLGQAAIGAWQERIDEG